MKETIESIKNVLDSKKAENIEVFDLTDTDYFVDYVVVATAIAAKHGAMLVGELKKEVAKFDEKFLHVDDGDSWTIIDMGDVLIHLMSEEYRRRYNVEEFLKDFISKKNRQTASIQAD